MLTCGTCVDYTSNYCACPRAQRKAYRDGRVEQLHVTQHTKACMFYRFFKPDGVLLKIWAQRVLRLANNVDYRRLMRYTYEMIEDRAIVTW
jgi:hypothetical protein